MRIAICDDEKGMVKKIAALLYNYFHKRDIPLETTSFSSGEELLAVGTADFDIVFLDIRMDALDGISVAKRIREYNSKVFIVFVTAYIDHVLDGYTVEAYRYLLKDQLESAIDDCLGGIIEKLALQDRKFTFDFAGGARALYENQIVCLESEKHKVFFHAMLPEEARFYLYGKLDDFEEQLEPYGFCRTHQSYLVNLRYVEDMNNYTVILKSGQVLPASKSKFQLAKQAFILYKGDL